MNLKKIIKRCAKWILVEQPKAKTVVQVSQIIAGESLKDRKIVITGGGRGLGFNMAKRFLSEGATVLITGRSQKTLEKAADELGKSVYILPFDISKVENAQEFLDKCSEMLGGAIDDLVLNAGISLHEGHFSNVTVEGFDQQFNTNYRANYFLGKYFLEGKINRHEQNGQLLVISSETGDMACDIPYGMTKAGINSMVRGMARRVYSYGLRVNAIAPGVTLSDMTKSALEDGNMYRDCASERLFLPDEVSEVAAFLLSDVSKCVSGEVIHCNAGNHIRPYWSATE